MRLKHPLPRYLIFHYNRFKLNNFFVEKNPTLVTFPVKNLELKDYIEGSPPATDGKNKIGTKFNLVSNVTHSGPADGGKYVSHVLHRANDEWYTIDDLSVQEILAQQVALQETYLQIYERADWTAEQAKSNAEQAAVDAAAAADAQEDDELEAMLD